MRKLFLLLIFCACAVSGWSQALPGVTVSSSASSGNTVTVTSSAPHGLAVGQGFCLSVPNLCAVAMAPTAGTTTTFSTTGGWVCASSCGVITPARQVIAGATTQLTPTSWQVQIAFWLTTSSPFASGATTSVSDATAAEKSAIAAGTFIEVQRSFQWTNSDSTASIKTTLLNAYNSAQATLSQSMQPGQFIGTYYNGTWSK